MTNRLITVLSQGNDEQIAYELTTTAWGSSPTNVEVKGYDITDGARTDVTATIIPGTPTVAGDVISLPALKSLTAGKTYRIEVKFTAGGNVWEPFFVVEAAY